MVEREGKDCREVGLERHGDGGGLAVEVPETTAVTVAVTEH